ncbi:hypothetical protein Tco_0912793 [Tanacetum coccineum]
MTAPSPTTATILTSSSSSSVEHDNKFNDDESSLFKNEEEEEEETEDKEQEGFILFGLPGSRQQKFLVLRFFDVKEQQGIDSMEVQNKLGSNNLVLVLKQESMEYMMKKRVWFEVELQGAQGDREAEVFQVSNDDTAVAQRRLEDKQPEEKTNTDCLVKEQKKEYQTGRKIKTGNVLDSYNQRSTQQFWSVQGSLGRGYNHVYISSEQGHHHQRLKTPIDMLGFFGWLASIKQGMLEPVKVVLYRNMGFNESGEYKKTFIGSGVGTGSMQVLQGDEFEVEPQDGHTFEVEPHGNVDHVVGSQEVQTQDLIYYHPARDREQHSVWELFSIEKTAGLKDDMDTRSDVYVLSNGCKKCSDDSDGYYWESTPGDCDVEKNGKWSCIYAVGSQEYQMVCTRLDIASADVGMLDKFDRGLQTDVHIGCLIRVLIQEGTIVALFVKLSLDNLTCSVDVIV